MESQRSPLRSIFHLLGVLLVAISAHCQQSTTLVTATTTVTATESGAGACNNFYGACVVYGTAGEGPYTTSVYAATSPTLTSVATHTTTTTVYVAASAATTAASDACQNFNGACVVYATNAQVTTAATTVYNSNGRPGNAQGYIGQGGSNDGGYISLATGLHLWTVVPIVSLVFVNLGFALWL